MNLLSFPTEDARLAAFKSSIQGFRARAVINDQHNTFAHESIAALKRMGYPALTLPKKYGGLEISISELVTLQVALAKEDGAAALAIGWHMGIVQHLGETQAWTPAIYGALAEEIVNNGALINNAASEMGTGSPTRGGKPETSATKTATGWVLSGRKTFTTLAPVLDYFAVSATIVGEDRVGNFLVRRQLEGVRIEETWDSIAMRATGSHDLVLDAVVLAPEDLVEALTPGKKNPQGWLLHIPAAYFGIASSAFDYAVNFANNYQPSSVIEGTIAQFPAVQDKIGQMRAKLIESRYLLYGVAHAWDTANHAQRSALGEDLGVAKVAVVNHALEIVDLAMRLVGAQSLASNNPLQRYYRDVRAGLHNPPMEDIVIGLLARGALAQDQAQSATNNGGAS